MYTDISICVHICIYLYICIYLSIYICMNVYIFISIYICMNVYIFIYIPQRAACTGWSRPIEWLMIQCVAVCCSVLQCVAVVKEHKISDLSGLVSQISHYGVATISRLLKIIGLLCRLSSLLQGSFAKETYNFKEPTNRSHSIVVGLFCGK